MPEPLLREHALTAGPAEFLHDTLQEVLEFLAVIDYPLPAWAKQYVAAMEGALGEAYAEPAADVRGYIGYVKSQKK